MIINAKATRDDANAQALAKPYRFTEEPRNARGPYAAAALLMGIALYIKSMFPGWSGAEAEAQAEPQPDEAGASSGRRNTPPDSGQSEGRGPSRTGNQEEASASNAGSGGNIVDLQRQASLESVLSPEFELIDYAAFGPVSAGPYTFAAASLVANDNAAPAASGPGLGGRDTNGPDASEPDTGEPDNGVPDGSVPVPPDTRDPEDEEEQDGEEERPNRSPRVNGPVHLADVGGCAITLIGLSELLANAVDPDGDTLSIRDITVSSGTLMQTQGGWLFESDGYGPVLVTYQITDGALAVMQTASFDVVRSSISGTSGDDLLAGTECGDDIDGGEGNDNIDARGGSDVVLGGAGDDHIVAGSGADTVFAGLGDDVVSGGDGHDWISGGEGNDRLFGDGGDDTLFGDDGDDQLSGGDGKDLLFGGSGDDQLSGDRGDDRLLGDHGDDELSGGAGDDILMGAAGADLLRGDLGKDTLSGGSGADRVEAGYGDDKVIGDLDGVSDRYDGGAGTDTIDYSAATASISFDLATGMVSSIEVGEDSISNFEIFVGGAGDDLFKANGLGGTFLGGAGNDIFEFETLSSAGQRVAYEVLDFMAGDRIKISNYEIFEEVMDSLEDQFEAVYGEDADDEDLPILISHEYTGNVRRTLIEADLDKDDYYELAVIISGDCQVTVSESV